MDPLRLPAELLAMIERGVSVIVGSRDAQLRPSVMRAVGSRVGPGEGEITVYLSRPQSRRKPGLARPQGPECCMQALPPRHIHGLPAAPAEQAVGRRLKRA